jgi:predicted RNase H-like HicB family nuclease
MLTDYINAAMKRAHYEILDDQPSDPFYGEIPETPGVLAIGRTLEECREELRSALEVWILLGVHFGTSIPVLDGIDLNELFVPSQEAA